MLVNDFAPLPAGGAERQAERLAAYMARQGLSVGVLTRREGNLPAQEQKDGYTIYRLPQFGPGKVKTLTFTISALLKLLSLRNRYHVLHAHLAFAPAIAGALAGHILGKKVIVKFGNSQAFGDVQRSKETSRGRLRLAILRRWADRIVTLDAEMEQEVLSAGFARQRVVQMDNGIDSREFEPAPDKNLAKNAYNLNKESLIVLFTGRLTPQKALPVLLRAMQQGRSILPDLHLLLVGHGEEETALQALTDELGLRQNVTFVGAVNNIHPYLAASDIFVLPSLAEGISNSLLEAMSCGLPCIATSVGGSSEVLGDGKYGILVPVNDVAELAAALIRLGLDVVERNRIGNEARCHILKRYDMGIVGKKYLDLYMQLTEAA